MVNRIAIVATLMIGSACNSWPALYSVKNPGRRTERLPTAEVTQVNSEPLRQPAESLAEIAYEPPATVASFPPIATEPAIVETVSAINSRTDDVLIVTNDTGSPTQTSSYIPVDPVAFTSSQVEVQNTIPKSAPTTRLAIAGVRPSRGKLKIAIYTDADSFPNPASASQAFELASTNPTMESPLPSVKQFAVAVYQDINSDGELNRNRFGIPTEPFAFSNNAMGNRGPPSFEQAVVVQPTEAGESGKEPFVVSIQLP